MPATNYVTVENGHSTGTQPAAYFSIGPGDAGTGAGVALLQSTPWWGNAALAQQWADNSNYESPNLNLDGDIGGNIEEVAFVYAFGGYRPGGTTMWSSKRLTDDWGIDNVTRFWSGGFAVANTPLSGITINQTGATDGASLLTTEAGGSSTFTVVLDTLPTANVTITLSAVSTDSGLVAREYSLSAPTLTFTTANWNTAQTVTVTGGNDDYDDGDRTYTLIATASNTGGYAGTERATTNVKNTDDDTNGVTITQTGTTDGSGNLLTTEAGSTSTFTVALNAKPSANVTVSITGLDATENSLSANTLTFTAANWNTAQTVTVTGVDDTLLDGDITTTLTATASNSGNYAGTESDTTTVKNKDDDTNGITITQTGTTDGSGNLRTTEAGSTSTFTVVLDAPPTADVTVSITGLDATENSLSANTLTFTAANWNTAQTVTVTGVDDTLFDGDITTTLTATANNAGGYAGTETSTVTVKNIDDDTNGITITQTGTTDGSGNLRTTEAGSTSTFTVVLDAAPTADVTVSITGLDATENSLSANTLTFTAANWNTAQTVTVTGVDDTLFDGDITTTLTATANNAGGYAGTETSTVTVKNIDDDTNGITITQTGTTDGSGNLRTTEAGSTSTFTVVLDAAPTADVTVSITGLDATENSLSANTLTFTAANWNTAQTVTVTGVDDTLFDGDITTTLTATANNAGGYAGTETSTVTVKNIDDDTNGITITQTGTTDGSGNLRTTEAGSTSTFTVVLDAAPTADVTVSITGLDATENSLSANTLTFTAANWNTAQTVTVTGVDDTLLDGDITTTLTATANNAGGYAGTETSTVTVKNIDDDTNGITITQTGTTDGSGNLRTTEAGSTSTFTVVLDAPPTADVTVSITGLDATENSLSTNTLTFTAANWNTAQTVTVTGVDDTLFDGDITTTLTATANNAGGYAGTETSTVTVKNIDDDTNGITITQTGTTDGSGNLRTTEAGSTSTFTVVLDAAPTADVTVSITGLDATENSLSANTLTFTAANWNTAQTVTVTGVDDTLFDGDITTTLTATANNAGGYAGTETSTVTVKNIDDDTNGITITQTGTTDDSGNLRTTEAGSTSTFTVVLDAPPTADVTVSITGLDATENSLSTNTLTFTAANWNTAQTVTVTGVDDTLFDGDITTTLTATANNAGGYAGTETSTVTVKNTDNNTPSPAVPTPAEPSPNPATPSPEPITQAEIPTGKDEIVNPSKQTPDINETANRLEPEQDKDGDGADDLFELNKDENNDGIDDSTQDIIATYKSSGGETSNVSISNPIDEQTDTEGWGINAKTKLNFLGIEKPQETSQNPGETILELQNYLSDNKGTNGGSKRSKMILATTDQPAFEIFPTMKDWGNIPQTERRKFEKETNKLFSQKIHRVDAQFNENSNWNAIFKPNKNGQQEFINFDPNTGLGGILVDTDNNGKADSISVFLKDNEKGDHDDTPFVINDPIGMAALRNAPRLKVNKKKTGLTVVGPKNSGLWINLQALSSPAILQTTLEIVNKKKEPIGAIGASPNSNDLGEKLLYLNAGDEAIFHQSTGSRKDKKNPRLKFSTEQDGSINIILNDNNDNDDDDLTVNASSSLFLKSDQINTVKTSRLQKHSALGILDLSDLTDQDKKMRITIKHGSDRADYKSELGLVKLENGSTPDSYQINGINETQKNLFNDAIDDNIIHFKGKNFDKVRSNSRKDVIDWVLDPADAGLYGVVMINSDEEVFTFGDSSGTDNKQHVKVFGDNYFGFEDLLSNQHSDWDFDDRSIKFDM